MKYRILVISKLEQKVIETSFVPRVGDKIALFYQPLPVVTEVVPVHKNMILFDNMSIDLSNSDFDAIITVD